MPTSRLTVVLGPLIALLLIGGLVVTVVRGPGDGAPPADDIARDDRTAEPQASEPQASQPADSEPPASEPPASDPTEEPATPLSPPSDSTSVDPSASPGADPAVTPAATATAEPAASPSAPADEPGVGGPVGVDDPTALTGWQGGTPNTGTAVSGAGLLLLAVAAGVFWLRRSRA